MGEILEFKAKNKEITPAGDLTKLSERIAKQMIHVTGLTYLVETGRAIEGVDIKLQDALRTVSLGIDCLMDGIERR